MTERAHRLRRASSSPELAGSLLCVLMGVLFAFVVILGKGLLNGDPPFALLTFRFGITAVLLLAVLLVTRSPLVPERGERLGLVVAATLGYGTESALYFSALNHGTAAAVTLLFYTYPVWVMLASIALDRRVPAGPLIAALVLAIGGAAVVVVAGSGVDVAPIGIVLALALRDRVHGLPDRRRSRRAPHQPAHDRDLARGRRVDREPRLRPGLPRLDPSARLRGRLARLRDGRVHGRRVRVHDREPAADRRRAERDHRRTRTPDGRGAGRAPAERTAHRRDRGRRGADPERGRRSRRSLAVSGRSSRISSRISGPK